MQRQVFLNAVYLPLQGIKETGRKLLANSISDQMTSSLDAVVIATGDEHIFNGKKMVIKLYQQVICSTPD